MNRHDKILERYIDDFQRDGYGFLGKKMEYYSGGLTIGEIDIFLQGKFPTICEVKSSEGGFEKGVKQLDRVKQYFGCEMERFLLTEKRIYTLGDNYK